MTAFLAIVKLTARSTFRSHVFQFLLALLIAGVILIPLTINGSAGPKAFIQVSLEYSLAFVTVMLSLSSVWLGCQTMTSDIEDSRLHMLVVKPVSRIKIWLGKFTGVLSVLTLLLLISSVVIYLLVMYQYSKLEMKPAERETMKNEVLTARRAFYPESPDIKALVEQAFSRQLASMDASGKRQMDSMTAEQREKAFKSLYKQVIASRAEIKVGAQPKIWTYKGLPDLKEGVFFVKYRAYSGSIIASSKNQEIAYGLWFAECHYERPSVDPKMLKPGEKAPPPVKTSAYVLPRNLSIQPPEEILCGPVNEFMMPTPEMIRMGIRMKDIISDGKASIGFINCPPSQKPVFIQQSDGPVILIKEASFTQNYFRAVLVMMLGLAGITAVSVSIGSLVSLPTAIFVTLSYLFFGFISDFLASSMNTYGAIENMPFMEKFGYCLSQILLSSVIPLQRFGISSYVAGGELIEWRMIGSLVFFQIILKGIPLALFCMWIYKRRELALASVRR